MRTKWVGDRFVVWLKMSWECWGVWACKWWFADLLLEASQKINVIVIAQRTCPQLRWQANSGARCGLFRTCVWTCYGCVSSISRYCSLSNRDGGEWERCRSSYPRTCPSRLLHAACNKTWEKTDWLPTFHEQASRMQELKHLIRDEFI